MQKTTIEELANEIQKELYAHIGPLLFGEQLHSALGFNSPEAFRQAMSRKTIPVEIFSLPNRRGRFALSRDVARWLAEERLKSETSEEN